MIDLHSHILPGLDDGAPNLEASMELARAATAEGTRRMVATPHINEHYRFDLEEIGRRTGELNTALARDEIPLAVLPGGEIAVSRLEGLDDERLRRLTLGGSGCLLVESPYEPDAPFLDDALFDLQVRGFTPMLAHPERSPLFQGDVQRLRDLVGRGTLCSIDAGSPAGRFGSKAGRTAIELLAEGLVHNVASDAHDLDRRPPGLAAAFDGADEELPGIRAQMDWFTGAVPAAILAGEPVPSRPAPPKRRPSALRRLGLRP